MLEWVGGVEGEEEEGGGEGRGGDGEEEGDEGEEGEVGGLEWCVGVGVGVGVGVWRVFGAPNAVWRGVNILTRSKPHLMSFSRARG